MWLNIVIFIFSSTVAGLLFKFLPPTFKSRSDFYQRMMPAIALLLLFLGVNLTLAFLAKLSLTKAMDLSPTETIEQLEALETDRLVVLTGVVSADNELVRDRDQEYVAYVARDSQWKPLWLLVDTADEGQVTIANNSYVHRHWPKKSTGVGRRTVQYLSYKQPVVVVGQTHIVRQLIGNEPGTISHKIHADLVYGGLHDEFVRHVQRRLWGPRIMMGLNAFALGAIAVMTILQGWKTFHT